MKKINNEFKKTLRSQRNSFNLKKLSFIYFSTLVSMLSTTVMAAATMEDIGSLGGFNINPNGISTNGSVIIGSGFLSSGYSHAFKYTDSMGMVDLGTLGGNESDAKAVSADGLIVVGESSLVGGYTHAFKYTDSMGMVDLGVLSGGTSSAAYAVSADGSVVVGSSTVIDNSIIYINAFKHTDDLGMVNLGTLGGSISQANLVSADGSIVVGQSTTGNNNDMHTFKHTDEQGMIDLGTLGGNLSQPTAMSIDGSVIVGISNSINNGIRYAFKYTDTSGMVNLGTFGGESSAIDISADGSVVVGNSYLDNGNIHSFKHTDDSGMVDLGSLGGNTAQVSAVSADGSTVVGVSTLLNNETTAHAFKHTDDLGMVDLGTLGGAISVANLVSADGSVISGISTIASGEVHVFIYKNKMIDVVDTQENLQKSAEQQTAALSFLQDKLTDALFQGCRPDSGNTCFSAGAKYYQQSNNEINDTAAYVNIAHRFQPKIYAGIYLEQSVSSGFANTIDASNEQPLVAVYGGFSPSENNLGLQIRAAAATHKVNAGITRPNTAYTEVGKGNTNFKGYSGRLEAAYALQATDKMVVSPVVGIRYSQVERNAYKESSLVDFPYQYDKMESKQTNLFAGIQTELSLSNKVNMYANVGLEQILDHSEEAFSANEQYLKGLKYNNPDVRHTKAYASTGVSYQVAPNQKIGLGVGYRQASFKSSRDGLNANLGYTVQF